jgi:hypothetical protein
MQYPRTIYTDLISLICKDVMERSRL